MSSQKRKFEEYHDPDYAALHAGQSTTSTGAENPPKKSKSVTAPTSNERLQKVREIIQREFGTELVAKEKEIDEIEHRLADAKQLLAKVRYAVVYNYYTRKNLVHSTFDLKAMEPPAPCLAESISADAKDDAPSASLPGTLGPDPEKLQPAIHPSLKKLLGKRPIDYNELLKVRPIRQAAKTATQNFHKPKKSTKIETKTVPAEVNTTIPSQEEDVAIEKSLTPNDVKIPRYVAPNAPDKRIEQVNSARGRNQYRHLIAVGNTSKYIGDEERDSATNVTHKWLVYIATKGAVPIDKIVSKVRFFLHESYRPNDIVEVLSPPFQIAKRGWGEFPLRVQLYFHPHLQQKPIQILHNLVLDKKHSGLQTMGAETVVEIWLNLPSSDDSAQSDSSNPEGVTIARREMSSTMVTIAKQTLEETPPILQSLKTTIKIEPEVCIRNSSEMAVKLEPPVKVQSPLKKSISQAPSNAHALPKAIAAGKPTLNASNILANMASGKRFIKCIDKTGKVSLIEMVADPNNPKIVKMVLPTAMRTTAAQPLSSEAKNRMITLPAESVPKSNTSVHSGQANPSRMPIIVSKGLEQLPFAKNVNKSVVISNGKVIIVDKPDATTAIKPRAQQSLLRPQISLLKPQRSDDKSLSTPTGIKGLKMITVNNLSGMESRNINVFLPTECESDGDVEIPRNKRFVVSAKKRRHLAHDLETEFQQRSGHFANVTASMMWLLKRLPLITAMASRQDYTESFPFAVDSVETFEAMPVPKQRSHEWLRAKFIARLVSKSSLARATAWTTKQIIIFARLYGYSPMPIVETVATNSKGDTELRNIVKSELMREHLQNDSISFNRLIIDWIVEAERNVESRRRVGHDGNDTAEKIIIVDDCESVESDCNSRVERQLSDCSTKGAKKLHLPTDARFQDECSWVIDVCRDAQIRLQSEEIVEGVIYPAAETMLTVALRSFVEDLLRRSSVHCLSRTSTEQLADVQRVSKDDIQRAITGTKRFDFLTNKRFGVATNIPS